MGVVLNQLSELKPFISHRVKQEARDIVNRVYRVCRVDGFKKDYSLIDQVKRSATSIMGNIACPVK